MSAAAKKTEKPAPKGDLSGRFGAWWNGKDYVPPDPAEAGEASPAAAPAAAKPASAPPPAPVKETAPALAETAKPAPPPELAPPSSLDAPSGVRPAGGPDLRLKALSALWGAERLGPGSPELDSQLLDPLFDVIDKPGDLAFIGADPALILSARSRSERVFHAAEWRTPCIDRIRELVPTAEIIASDADRPRGFGEGNLAGLISIDAFAFADHKAGLAARAFRALNASGRWMALDITRTTGKTPAECFASAWAEPQLGSAKEIEDLLKLAGFFGVTHIPLTGKMLLAAQSGFRQLGEALDQAVKAGLAGREGAIFLQELTWELQTWRARCRALEGGALSVNLWIADKDPANAIQAIAAARAVAEPDALFEDPA